MNVDWRNKSIHILVCVSNSPTTVYIVHFVLFRERRRFHFVRHRSVENTDSRHFRSECNPDTTHRVVGDGGNLTSATSPVVVGRFHDAGGWVVVSRIEIKAASSIEIFFQIRVIPFQPWNIEVFYRLNPGYSTLKYLGTRAAEHKGCNWGMQIDWWLQPRAVFGHTFSGIIWHMPQKWSQSNCMTLSWWPCHKIVSVTFTFTSEALS